MSESEDTEWPHRSWRFYGDLFVPAKTTFIPKRGDAVYAIGSQSNLRRDNDGAWFEPQAFCVPAQRTPFGPLIKSGFANVREFDDPEWTALSEALGVEITPRAREVIHGAANLLINTILLRDKAATWAQLRSHVSDIEKLATPLLEKLQLLVPDKPTSAAIPASQTVGAFVATRLDDAPFGLIRLIADLKALDTFCKEATLTASNGPGTEDQAEFRIFLGTILDEVTALGGKITLLSNSNSASWDPSDEAEPPKLRVPPFLAFVLDLLSLVALTGEEGILLSSATEEAKQAAVAELRTYTKEKSLKALSKQLRRLVKNQHPD